MAKKASEKKEQEDQYVEVTMPDGFMSLFTPISVILGAIIIAVSIVWAASKVTGTDNVSSPEDENEVVENTDEVVDPVMADGPGEEAGELATFTEYDVETCKTEGKPDIYLFTTSWCPHCTWIKDTFIEWANANSDKANIYHWDVDTGDNLLTEEVETEVPEDHMDIYEVSNPSGSIPTFVFGCKYVRVGNGYEAANDLEAEKEAFDTVLKELL